MYQSQVFWLIIVLSLVTNQKTSSAAEPNGDYDLFARSNLVAWCIVPFDSKKRGPEERAAMLQRMGIQHFAYDYRAEHVPTFDAEVEAVQRRGIQLVAWWFPTTLNAEATTILDVLKRHRLRTQLWVMGGGAPTKTAQEQKERVKAEADRVRPIAEAAARIGCSIGLYNHGGWFGEPENQLAIIEQLKMTNVGMVYNLHHAQDQIDRFPETLRKIGPHLLVLNLNGTMKDGDKHGEKIVPLAEGSMDLQLLKTIEASAWRGPLGILCHADVDAEARLLDNLDGLDWLVKQLKGGNAGPKPRPRSFQSDKTN